MVTTTEAPRLVGVNEFLRSHCQISMRKARQLIADKTLPTVRIGRRVMIDLRDFDRFVQAQKVAK